MWTGSQYTSEIPSFPSQRLPSGFTASFVYPSCTWEILSLTKLKLVTLQNITIFFFFLQKLFKFLGWQNLPRTHVISTCCDFFWFFFPSGNFLLLRSRSGLYRSLVPQDPMARAWTVFMILWRESFERLFILSSSLALLIFERCLKCLQSRMQEL